MNQMTAHRLADHSVCHGVGEMLLQAGRHPQHLVLVPALKGHDIRHHRLRLGQGSRLVKDDGIRLRHSLHVLSALYGDMVPAGLTHGGQHRKWHSQLQRTGEIHHQDRQGLGNVAGQKPGKDRSSQAPGYQGVRQSGRLALHRGLQLFRLLNHMNDTLKAGRTGGLLYADGNLALFHRGSRVYIASCFLVDGNGLPGHGGLVNHGFPFRHNSI